MGLFRSFKESPYCQSFAASPILSSLSTLLIICVVTRIITGVRSSIAHRKHDAEAKSPNTIPYWLPFAGTALSFLRNIESTITHDRYTSGDGIFSYRMGLGKAYVISMPSLVQQVFAQRGNVLNKVKTLEWFMNAAFDDEFAFRDEHEAVHGHHNALNLMLKSEFTTEATNKTARAVEVKAAQLITEAPWLSPEGKTMELWEEAGNVKFNTDGTFDTNLFNLVVNYMGQIVIDMLWGKALIQNFPTLQVDMWEFDQGVHSILRPLIGKHTPSGRRGIAARERIGIALKEWHDAVAAKLTDQTYDTAKWGALDDVSQVMLDRARVWLDTRASGRLQITNDISVLWGVNVNSNKNVFWMLMQLHSRPSVLSDVREEIAPYVHISPTSSSSPEHGFPQLSIDVDGLVKNCPLLKASFYETMRLNMAGLGVREIQRDVVLRESSSDAALFGKTRAQSYNIPAGSTLVIANGPMQMDPRIFPDPEEFRPERFIEEGPDGKTRATMKNLHTFGGGMYKCKGRYFAEKEVMIFASALLVMWDIAPVEGEVLEVPGMGNVGGSRRPVGDVRVRLTRRYN